MSKFLLVLFIVGSIIMFSLFFYGVKIDKKGFPDRASKIFMIALNVLPIIAATTSLNLHFTHRIGLTPIIFLSIAIISSVSSAICLITSEIQLNDKLLLYGTVTAALGIGLGMTVSFIVNISYIISFLG